MIVILALGLAALVALALIYHAQQEHKRQQAAALAADKAAFATVETQMAKTYAAIVASAGKPTKGESFKSCAPIAHKYDDSDIHCDIGYDMHYDEENLQAAISRLDSLKSTLNVQKWLRQDTSMGFKESNQIDERSSGTKNYINIMNGINCELYFEFNRNNHVNAIKSLDGRYLFRCGKKVTIPVYALAK